MREGWYGEEYLVLFDASEVSEASVRYDIASSLPGYEVLGLRGWDDLIVRDTAGRGLHRAHRPTFTRVRGAVPTA
jgi:hypothetical protein